MTKRKSDKRSAGWRAKHDVESLTSLAALNAAAAALRQLGRKLRPTEAATYLTHARNTPTTAGTLANLRVKGGGPRFSYSGRYVNYDIPDLDTYADERNGPEQSTTSARAA